MLIGVRVRCIVMEDPRNPRENSETSFFSNPSIDFSHFARNMISKIRHTNYCGRVVADSPMQNHTFLIRQRSCRESKTNWPLTFFIQYRAKC